MVVWGLWPQWGPGVESLVTTGARGRSPAEAKNFLALRRSKEGEIYLSRPGFPLPNCCPLPYYGTIVHFPVLNKKKTSRFAIRNKITAEKIRFTKMHELLQLSDRVGFG